MLTLNGQPFTEGQTLYVDVDPEHSANKQAIYIEVILPIDAGIGVYAMVDTGSPYCIFNTELVEALRLASDDGEKISLSTPYGRFRGTIQRVTIGLKATQGTSLDIDASIYVPDEHWRFGNFLGYTGFLERFRCAIDPSTYMFYFGKYDIE
jgi:hypothetical protein